MQAGAIGSIDVRTSTGAKDRRLLNPLPEDYGRSVGVG